MSSYSYDNQNNARPELSFKPADKRPMLFGGIAAVVIVLVFLGISWFLFVNPEATAVIRDIFIIFMGLGILVIILLLIALVVITAYLVLKINDLVQLLDREIKPMLTKLHDMLTTARGTTTFISEHAVEPVISTASTVSAVQAIFRSLFQRG